MAWNPRDRVKVETTTTGTGTLTCTSVSGYEGLSAIGDGNSACFTVFDDAGNWESFIGTVGGTGTTISRDTVKQSSNSDSAVNFSAGTKTVICTLSSEDAFVAGSSAAIPDAQISESSVTQHEAALTITESQISDLGSYITTASVTFETMDANGDVGTGASQLAAGNHTHSGVYEPVDATIIRQADVDDTPVNGVTTAPISSNWAFDHNAAVSGVHGISGTIVGTTDTQTLTNKTLTDPAVTGTITEDQYNLTGTAIDPSNGAIQYKTLSANTTFTESIADGEVVTLAIDDGTGYTITWPTITWMTDGGSAPTLKTSGYTFITLLQMNGTLYGFRTGDGG